MPRLSRLAIPLVIAVAFSMTASPVPGHADGEATTVVCPSCPLTSLDEAIAGAAPGDRIEVRGGVYPGGLTIDKNLSLVGIDWPVIDGGGEGSLISVVGAEVAIEGFVLAATGSSHDHEDGAITFDGGRATIIGNRIEDALFGVYLKQAPRSVIRDNVIEGKRVEIAMRGDGIKVWYCDDVVIEGNQASGGRDVLVWYSNRAIVRDNHFDHERYGLHLMNSDDALIERNSLQFNSIGLYIMYGRDPRVIGNTLANNHGPSGGGVGLKDVDRAVFEGNRFVNNQIAAQIDTSPRELKAENVWRGNVFAFNQVGVGFMQGVRRNTLVDNSFIDNTEHVAVLGRGQLQEIAWAVDGRGNYWSDYAGYDADGDGVGDRPYRSQRLFESLMDEHPTLKLFLFSPAVTALDFAAKAFPEVRPETKFEDPAPLMSPPHSPYLPALEATTGGSRAALGIAGSLIVGGGLLVVARLRPRPARAGRRPRRFALGGAPS